MRALFLIGPRGSGKSAVAGIVGKSLGLPVQDTDEIAARLSGLSVAGLVAAGGWPAFRSLESRALRQAAEKGGVIATGGGIVLDPDNRRHMRDNGLVFYLSAPAQVLARRLMKNPRPELRPPLTGLDPIAEIAAVLAERDALYRETAHHVVDAAQPLRRTAETIIRRFTAPGGQEPL
jgi:shikimate kinase